MALCVTFGAFIIGRCRDMVSQLAQQLQKDALPSSKITLMVVEFITLVRGHVSPTGCRAMLLGWRLQ